ncbi:hypothetical protein GGX14DRAFT_392961 [Mycena pura]|uniref:Uncharacterized protein n=1 Tax=Mycena pura TaxID=153505 RepID=A0AAD6VI45_9AGAR|nr:hypothetical protein GGX14DRAFT_392961 [Mycena pura]
MGDDDGVYLRIQGGATSRQYEHYRALCNSRVNRFGADPLAGAVGAEVEEEARAAHASGWRAQILAEIGNSTDSHPEVRVAPVADSCGERGQIDVARVLLVVKEMAWFQGRIRRPEKKRRGRGGVDACATKDATMGDRDGERACLDSLRYRAYNGCEERKGLAYCVAGGWRVAGSGVSTRDVH